MAPKQQVEQQYAEERIDPSDTVDARGWLASARSQPSPSAVFVTAWSAALMGTATVLGRRRRRHRSRSHNLATSEDEP